MDTQTKLLKLEARLAALHKASLEVVQDISLNSLLQRIVHIACDQVEARYAALGVNDENGKLILFITTGLTEEEQQKITHKPKGLGLLGVLSKTKVSIRLDDVKQDPRSVGFPTGHPEMRAFLGVPIRLNDRNLGQIYLADKVGSMTFSQEDEQVIETLASYAAIAIYNARSYDDLHERDRTLTRRNQDLALLNDLASMLASTSEMDAMLNTALTRVINYFNFEVGEIFLREEDQKTLHLVMHQGNTVDKLWKRDRFLLSEGLIGKTAFTGQASLVKIPHKDDPDLAKRILATAGITQLACIPLTSRSEVLGVLCVATRQVEPIDKTETQLLTSIASWIGTTMENMRLNIQGRRLAILEERERIGMDLHDGIIQSIYAVGLTLEHARLLFGEDPEGANDRINQSIGDLNSTIRDIRAFIMDLRPRQLYEDNLIDGIKRLINEFRANTMIEASFSEPGGDLSDLPDACTIALFHICQEGLANVAKHAHAHKVEVLLWVTSDRALLEIHDDGRGFDAMKVKFTLGHGLSNMQTRARNVGGDVDITSEPGEGTTILAWVPFIHETESEE